MFKLYTQFAAWTAVVSAFPIVVVAPGLLIHCIGIIVGSLTVIAVTGRTTA